MGIADATSRQHFKLPQRMGGVRTVTVVPLRREKTLLGILGGSTTRCASSPKRKSRYCKTFPRRPVVAISMAEQREAWRGRPQPRKCCRSSTLQPGNLAPVFDGVFKKRCGCAELHLHILFTFNGEFFHAVAMRGVPHRLRRVAEPELPAKVAPGSRHARRAPNKATGRISRFSVAINLYQHGSASDRAIVNLGGARPSPLRAAYKR